MMRFLLTTLTVLIVLISGIAASAEIHELVQQADIEARRLSASGKLSAEGRKRLKYGTRTLMGKTLQLEWDDSL